MLKPTLTQENTYQQFALQAEQHPQAVAVIDETDQLSYRELSARADAVAACLQAQGLEPEQAVAVLMNRRADLLAVLLGIWKAGGAYVPFDPREPFDRLYRMQTSCDSTLMMGDRELLDGYRQHLKTKGVTLPRMIATESIPFDAVNTAPTPVPTGGSRLAYLLFTSGSTGEPKAVEVEHQQVQALLQSACKLLGFSQYDRYLAASTIAFDASVTELFLPLVTGASLLLRDRRILLDPRRLAREVVEYGVTVIQTGPSVWQVMLAEVPDFPRVRVAITHGEAISPEFARQLAQQGDTVWNLYGPTETTVWATGAQLRTDDPPGLSTTSAPIGYPLPHVVAHVLDDDGIPVPDGEAGELCLGGSSVARGYRNHAELTRAQFVTIHSERMYRSGDLVVRDANGALHYFGRNDDQIKVRGVRVEPGEIEAALQHIPQVSQAAATWFTTASGTKAIVAALVLKPGATALAGDLHQSLSTILPATMIPARYLFLPVLPITTNGKVDRAAIRTEAEAPPSAGQNVPETREPGSSQTRQPPRRLNYTEQAIARVWQRILGLEVVAPDDHFFSIGGDSLAAVQMMLEIEERFGLLLPVHLAFEAPTLETLSLRVERAQQKQEDELSSGFVFPLVTAGEGPPIFFSGVELSFARRGVWELPCPLFSIANWAIGSGFVNASSLSALAAEHLEAVRQLQPAGPYRLAGYSLGGLIALEMAHQLRAAGETVEMLFLLDPMAPEHVRLSGDKILSQKNLLSSKQPESLRKKISKYCHKVVLGPDERGVGEYIKTLLQLPGLPPIQRPAFFGWLHYLAVNQYLRRPNVASRLMFPRTRWRAFWFAAQRMVGNYVALPYDGSVVAVFCQQGLRGEVWKSLLGPNAREYWLEAPHLALFDEDMLKKWMGWLGEYLHSSSNHEPGQSRTSLSACNADSAVAPDSANSIESRGQSKVPE